jgi:predicted permease
MHSFQDKLVSFLISQALIWIPLLAGRWLRKRALVREAVSRPLHAFNLACITPLVYGLGTWRLDRSAPGWFWVPVVMTILMALLTAVAAWASFRLIPRRDSAGTFALMIPISNTGHTMAGFLTLLLLGEHGYAYNSLLMLCIIPFVSLVWLPLAAHWGQRGGQAFWRTFVQSIFSAQMFQMVGLGVGLALNFGNVPMAAPWNVALKITVFGGTALIAFAMGLKLRFGRLGGYHRMLSWVYLAKFVVAPAAMVGLCFLFGLHGLAAGALFLAAIAPSGVNVVAFSTLYDLDVDLANAGYLWSTFFFMLFVLPLVIWLLQVPFFRL